MADSSGQLRDGKDGCALLGRKTAPGMNGYTIAPLGFGRIQRRIGRSNPVADGGQKLQFLLGEHLRFLSGDKNGSECLRPDRERDIDANAAFQESGSKRGRLQRRRVGAGSGDKPQPAGDTIPGGV